MRATVQYVAEGEKDKEEGSTFGLGATSTVEMAWRVLHLYPIA